MTRTASTVIRLARPGDAEVIADMSRELIEQGLQWRWRARRVRQLIRRRDVAAIVAEQEGDISGFAIAGFSETRAHLNLLAVGRPFRRQGIASALVAWLIGSCRVAGIGRIDLEVRLGNFAAIACYRGLGFRPAGIRRGYYDGLEDAQLMSLRLIPEAQEQKRPRQ